MQPIQLSCYVPTTQHALAVYAQKLTQDFINKPSANPCWESWQSGKKEVSHLAFDFMDTGTKKWSLRHESWDCTAAAAYE